MDEWTRYMGHHITPEQYAAQGGNEASIRRDLNQLWGKPTQGLDYMNPDAIATVAKALAQQLPSS